VFAEGIYEVVFWFSEQLAAFVVLCIFGAVSVISPELATALGVGFGLLLLGSFALFLIGNRE
jgi:hypothetical protein